MHLILTINAPMSAWVRLSAGRFQPGPIRWLLQLFASSHAHNV